MVWEYFFILNSVNLRGWIYHPLQGRCTSVSPLVVKSSGARRTAHNLTSLSKYKRLALSESLSSNYRPSVTMSSTFTLSKRKKNLQERDLYTETSHQARHTWP